MLVKLIKKLVVCYQRNKLAKKKILVSLKNYILERNKININTCQILKNMI